FNHKEYSKHMIWQKPLHFCSSYESYQFLTSYALPLTVLFGINNEKSQFVTYQVLLQRHRYNIFVPIWTRQWYRNICIYKLVFMWKRQILTINIMVPICSYQSPINIVGPLS